MRLTMRSPNPLRPHSTSPTKRDLTACPAALGRSAGCSIHARRWGSLGLRALRRGIRPVPSTPGTPLPRSAGWDPSGDPKNPPLAGTHARVAAPPSLSGSEVKAFVRRLPLSGQLRAGRTVPHLSPTSVQTLVVTRPHAGSCGRPDAASAVTWRHRPSLGSGSHSTEHSLRGGSLRPELTRSDVGNRSFKDRAGSR
jgi:hypothetical protein